ncbi:MAG: hypothetical protein JWQ18_1785 [Conexibacter sp.]|nr:hypothetical protein [Conexibacter sp.]
MLNARKSLAVIVALVACAILAPAAQASWSVTSGAVAAVNSQLQGVACVTTSNCILVGPESGGTTSALISKWNGSVFTTQTPASTTSELYGTGCNSATFCVAVGANYASGAVPHAESYNGTTWTTTTTAVPSGSTFAELSRVACPGSTSCFAAGYYHTSTATLPLVERWNGTTWAIQTLTLPSGATNAELAGIGCSSTTACTAVGYYESSGNPRRTMILRWNGTAWSAQTGVNQSGATLSELQGVACTSSTVCVAVGDYADASSVQHSLSETWNGTTWTLKTVADPSGGTDPALYDVSCFTSPTSGCEAVGGYTGVASNLEPLAAGWNGTAWSLQTVPKPSGATDAVLSGVSCPTTCMADGVDVGSSGVPSPMAVVGP